MGASNFFKVCQGPGLEGSGEGGGAVTIGGAGVGATTGGGNGTMGGASGGPAPAPPLAGDDPNGGNSKGGGAAGSAGGAGGGEGGAGRCGSGLSIDLWILSATRTASNRFFPTVRGRFPPALRRGSPVPVA